jgi:hypothetical protein
MSTLDFRSSIDSSQTLSWVLKTSCITCIYNHVRTVHMGIQDVCSYLSHAIVVLIVSVSDSRFN